MRHIAFAGFLLLTAAAGTAQTGHWQPQPIAGATEPSEVVAHSAASDWRPIAPENLLVMDLADGHRIAIELAPEFAPVHVANIRRLAAQGEASHIRARQRKQIFDQRLQMQNLILHHQKILFQRMLGMLRPMGQRRFKRTSQGRDRRSQLVRCAGDELAPRFEQARYSIALQLQIGHSALESGSHGIEIGLELGYFVFTLYRHAHRVIARAQDAGCRH